MAKAIAWTVMLAYPVDDEYHLLGKAMKNSANEEEKKRFKKDIERFEKDLENKSPHRIFPSATVEDYLSGKIRGRKKESKKKAKGKSSLLK